jgi:carbonic anhydrase
LRSRGPFYDQEYRKVGSKLTAKNCDGADCHNSSLVPPDDASSHAVIEYAVEHLKVKYSAFIVPRTDCLLFSHFIQVVIVGHSRCGGVTAAWEASKDNEEPPLEWLTPVVELSDKLGLNYEPAEKAIPALTKANVWEQVCSSSQLLSIR